MFCGSSKREEDILSQEREAAETPYYGRGGAPTLPARDLHLSPPVLDTPEAQLDDSGKPWYDLNTKHREACRRIGPMSSGPLQSCQSYRECGPSLAHCVVSNFIFSLTNGLLHFVMRGRLRARLLLLHQRLGLGPWSSLPLLLDFLASLRLVMRCNGSRELRRDEA